MIEKKEKKKDSRYQYHEIKKTSYMYHHKWSHITKEVKRIKRPCEPVSYHQRGFINKRISKI
jgi:hypothetical protein